MHNCYINFKEGDNPWASSDNALDAINDAVNNYVNSGLYAPNIATKQKYDESNDALQLFLSKDALFVWYFFARKYGKKKIIQHYETFAQQTNPRYLNIIRFIFDKVNEAVQDPTTTITPDYPALRNLFIMALVYYESLSLELYKNNAIIKKMIETSMPEDREAFDRIQETIGKVDTEIQKIIEEE